MESNEVSSRLAALEAHVQRTERRARRWRLSTMGAVAAGAVAVFTGQNAPAGPVTGSRIVLQDGEANTRAELKMQDDNPHLTFYDPSGSPRVDLYANEGGGVSLGFLDSGRTVRAALATNSNGSSNLIFHDAEGNQRMAVSAGADNGSGGVVFRDAGGDVEAQFTVSNGRPNIALRDAEGRLRAILAIRSSGAPVLMFLDDEGNVTEQVPE